MIERSSRDRELPLSFNQDVQLLADWLSALQAWKQVPFHPCTAHFLLPGIDTSAVEAALNAIVSRHEVLRTAFSDVFTLPPSEAYRVSQQLNEKDVIMLSLFKQRILPSAKLELSVQRTPADPHNLEGEIIQLLQKESCKPFRYESPPLMRATLFHLSKKESLLLIALHHLVADRWSLAILHRELAQFYRHFRDSERFCGLADLSVQYADFASWQRQQMASGSFTKMISYWTEQWDQYLPGRLTVADLPFGRPLPRSPTFRCSVESIALDHRLCDEIRQFARTRRVTLFMFWHAAWTALFHSYSGKSKIALFANLANRTQLETEELIGWVSNSVLMGVSVCPDLPIEKLLECVRNTVLGAYTYQALPLGALWGTFLKKGRHSNLDVSDWIALDFVNASEQKSQNVIEGLSDKLIAIPPFMARTSLQLSVKDTGNGMIIQCTYSVDRFLSPEIQQMLDHVRTIATAFIESPSDTVQRMSSRIRPGLNDDSGRLLAR